MKAQIPKKKFTKSSFRQAFRLFAYLKPYRWEYILGMFFLFGSSLANLAFPKLLGDLVNSGNAGRLGEDLNRIALILGALLLVQSLFSYFRTVLFVNVTEKSMALLRQDTFNHLIRLPLSFFDRHRVGELNSRISADIQLLQETLTTTLAEFIRQVIIITGGITLLLITSLKLTLFMLAVMPGIVLLVVFFGRFIRRFSRQVQDEIARANTIVEETLQGIRSVKAFTNEFLEMKRYKGKTDRVARIGMKSGKYRGAFAAFVIFGLFGAMVAVIWQGSKLLANGTLEAGQLFSFVLYTGFIAGSIGGMANVITRMQRFLGATEDLFETFNLEEESLSELERIPTGAELTGDIRLDGLSFAYPSRPDVEVLHDLKATIPANRLTALVGPSGAGKSTLSALLLRLYEPTQGKIWFDGKESTEIPLSVLRRQVALVPQDIFLFGGTIRENVAYGNPEAPEEQVVEALKNANAWTFVEKFPEHLDTVVGERGTQLSGGQRQRVAIARAMLKNPRILILDEATSSLDSESEKLVQDALEKLMTGRTSIVIAHRLATIRKADLILVLDHGRLAEQGTHEQLIRKQDGIYHNLSKLQFDL